MLYVQIDTKKLDLAMKIVPRELKMELGDAFDYIGKKFLKTLKATHLSGPPGLRWSRGIFRRFKRTMLVPTGGIEGMGTTIWSESKVAPFHERGGPVTAPSGGSMAVPLSMRTKMFNAKGALKRRYKHPSQLKNTRLMVLKGKRFLVEVQRRSDKITPLYVLKKRIMLKPRLGWYDTWRSMDNIRMAKLNRAVTRALAKV